ncbi:MAG: family 20 glycosylhydrolase, partial [Bacteroidales bacterium]
MENRTQIKQWLFAGFCLTALSLNAQKQLLPQPQQIVEGKGFLKTKGFTLTNGNSDLTSMLETAEIGLSESGKKLSLTLVDQLPGVKANFSEAYKLLITKDGVQINAITNQGLFWGLQTLSQLLKEYPNGKIPCMEITDWPSFKVRGLMQDVGRSYISLPELKQEIATLAKYKINVFHWHLTENQAWRLESKVFPELVADSNMTRMPGKYYTHEEAKELQAFCKQNHVML